MSFVVFAEIQEQGPEQNIRGLELGPESIPHVPCCGEFGNEERHGRPRGHFVKKNAESVMNRKMLASIKIRAFIPVTLHTIRYGTRGPGLRVKDSSHLSAISIHPILYLITPIPMSTPSWRPQPTQQPFPTTPHPPSPAPAPRPPGPTSPHQPSIPPGSAQRPSSAAQCTA